MHIAGVATERNQTGWRRVWPVSGDGSVLASATLVNTLGHGLSLAVAALFFTHVVGLDATSISWAFSIAGVGGLLTTFVAGHVVDRLGAKPVMIVATVLAGALTLGLLITRNLPMLTAVISGQVITSVFYQVARGAIVPEVFPANERVKARAFLRSLTNLGSMAGATLAIPAIATGSPRWYEALIALDAATFFITAGIAMRLHVNPAPSPAKGEKTRKAVFDGPFMAFVGVNGLLTVQDKLFTLGVPLWIITATEAPKWLPGIMLTVNTLIVIVAQVPFSKGSDNPRGAVRAQRWAGLVIAGACLLYATTGEIGRWEAFAVVIVAVVLHTLGEILQMAGGFGISYGMAPEGHHGDYQSTYLMGVQLASIAAPVLIAWLIFQHGMTGWFVTAGIFVLAALLVTLLQPCANARFSGEENEQPGPAGVPATPPAVPVVQAAVAQLPAQASTRARRGAPSRQPTVS